MKIKSGFVVEKVGNKYLAVAVGERADDFNALIRMNGTGAFLFNLLSEKDMTKEELLSAMLKEYDVDTERAKADILAFLTALNGAGLLDE